MTGTEMRTGLVANLIRTLKKDTFCGARTGIIMETDFPTEDSTRAASAKRDVVVVVSDKVGFDFMAA